LVSEKEKTHPKIETKKETENRGSAVPLHEKDYPLNRGALNSVHYCLDGGTHCSIEIHCQCLDFNPALG
jgi:hypothetical protein